MVFGLELEAATPLRAVATSPGGEAACAEASNSDFWSCDGAQDLTLGLLDGAGACLASDPTMLEVTLGPGSYAIVVGPGPEADAGAEYVLGLVRCFEDDAACAP